VVGGWFPPLREKRGDRGPSPARGTLAGADRGAWATASSYLIFRGRNSPLLLIRTKNRRRSERPLLFSGSLPFFFFFFVFFWGGGGGGGGGGGRSISTWTLMFDCGIGGNCCRRKRLGRSGRGAGPRNRKRICHRRGTGDCWPRWPSSGTAQVCVVTGYRAWGTASMAIEGRFGGSFVTGGAERKTGFKVSEKRACRTRRGRGRDARVEGNGSAGRRKTEPGSGFPRGGERRRGMADSAYSTC